MGLTIGGIFTIVGFSSTGKHIRNIFPIMAGVYLAGLTKRWNISDPSPMLAFLFSTTLAPISGEFGWLGRTGGRFPSLLGGLKRGNCIWGNESL